MPTSATEDQEKQEDHVKNVYTGSKLSQWYSGFAVNLGVFTVGCAWSWSATAFSDLKVSNALGEITDTAESWITAIAFPPAVSIPMIKHFLPLILWPRVGTSSAPLSVHGNRRRLLWLSSNLLTVLSPLSGIICWDKLLGGVVSCLVSGLLIQAVGLRTSMLLQTLPLVGAWILIIFATNVTMMMIGRFFTGFFACGIAVAAPAFVAETSEVELRGKLGFGYDVLGSLGHFYIYFVGAYVTQSWRWQAVACGIPPIVIHSLMLFVPDSPLCLLRRARPEEAYQALCWFRGCAKTTDESQKQLVTSELNDMQKSIDRVQFVINSDKSWSQRYLNSQTLKPTLLGMVLMVFFQLTGAMAVFAYTVEIFQDAGSEDGRIGTVLVGFAQTVFTIIPGFFVDKIGRKILLITSEVFTSLPLILLGVYVYLREEGGGKYDDFVNDNNWIPILALFLFSSFFAMGMAPVCWVIVGELVPPAAKGLSSGIISVTARTFGFLVVLLFKDLVKLFGQYGCYWFFAVCCIVGSVYIGFFIPETTGKSLDEINRNFMSKSDRLKENNNAESLQRGSTINVEFTVQV